jgi:phage/plasmid-like protein (TIGR03299 family)
MIQENDHMVSANNITPWHKLGTVFPDNLTAAQALEEARLNWEVGKEPIYDADMVAIQTHMLTRRSDTKGVLGVVGKDWTPIQNNMLLDVAEALVQADADTVRPMIETAGSLRDGRLVWCLVKTGSREFGGAEHRAYILLSNSHDGTRGLRATMTDVRVVCNNTLRVAESDRANIFLMHTKNIEARFQDAINTLKWANEATRLTFEAYGLIAMKKIGADVAANFFHRVASANAESETPATKWQEERIEQLMHLYRNGPGNEGLTAFDAMNAVTDYVDHYRPMRGGDDGEKTERRFVSTLLGDGASMKAKAFAYARQLANA